MHGEAGHPSESRVAAAAAQLAGVLIAEESLDSLLERVCRVAVEVLPGAVGASVTVLGDQATTVAFSGPEAIEADERQYDTREGPCLDAATSSDVLVVEDYRTETRWPAYAPRAAEAGVLSSVSVPVPMRDVHAALNVYSSLANAFDADASAAGVSFATVAAAAIGNAHTYEKTAQLAEQLTEAMASRAVIEQAKGIVMAENGCSAEEAFQILRRASMGRHVKVRDIAQAVVNQVAARSSVDGKPSR